MASTRSTPRQGRPPKVSRRDVVDAAVALADEQGLAAVAGRLGVAPMTLYGHVTSAEEMVDLVVGATIAVAVAEHSESYSDGRSELVGFAHALRSLSRSPPGGSPGTRS